MTLRHDDDPVHPNWDGIAFQASTDRKGIVITPTSAQSRPPYSYLTISHAIAVLGDLRAVIYGLEAYDPASYFGVFLEGVASDLADAIEDCRPAPEEPEPETTADAPKPDLQGTAA